ncbi:MAG: class I SAM-dependent methyltransferase [bacterium]
MDEGQLMVLAEERILNEVKSKRTSNKNVAIERLILVDNAFFRLEKEFNDFSLPEAQNKIIALMHFLTYAVEIAEKNGLVKEDIRSKLFNAWRIHGYSSFVKHIQIWPRGYPGDFEVVNMIADRNEKSAENTLGGVIGRYALNNIVAQQHREKLKIQAELVREVCQKFKAPNVISIASGSSRDLEEVQYELKESNAKVLLIDFDKDALEESKRRLSDISSQVDTFLTDVRRLPQFFKGLNERGRQFHLVYAGGLFDYLPDGIIKIILKNLSDRFMHEDGILMFTNIAKGNPYRAWIETMGNWKLIERSKEEMNQLLLNVCSKEQSLKLDPTGLTWIVRVHLDRIKLL